MEKLRKLSAKFGSFLVFELGWDVLWPIIITGAGFMIGLGTVPLFYLYVGSVVLLSASTSGLFWFSQLRLNNTTENKIKAKEFRLRPIVSYHENYEFIEGIVLGVCFENTAIFPIKYRIKAMRSSVVEVSDGYFLPPNKGLSNKETIIPPNGRIWFDDYEIDLHADFSGDAIARVQCSILYGRKGKLDQRLEINKKTFFHSNNKKAVTGGVDWYDG